MICGDSFLKWFEIGFLIGTVLCLILSPIYSLIEWKWYCKKYGKETAREIFRRM